MVENVQVAPNRSPFFLGNMNTPIARSESLPPNHWIDEAHQFFPLKIPRVFFHESPHSSAYMKPSIHFTPFHRASLHPRLRRFQFFRFRFQFRFGQLLQQRRQEICCDRETWAGMFLRCGNVDHRMGYGRYVVNGWWLFRILRLSIHDIWMGFIRLCKL